MMKVATFRFNDLSTDYNALRVMSIGEDATRVIGRVDYDSETNRCIGFLLPPDDHGLATSSGFIFTYLICGYRKDVYQCCHSYDMHISTIYMAKL